MPRFAANLSLLFTELPLENRFEAAARAGFKAVELILPYDHDPDELAGLLYRYGLHLVLFNLCPGDFQAGERGLACLPGRQDAFREALEEGRRYVDILRPDCVHLMAGFAEPEADRDALNRTYIDNVRLAAQTLAPYGTTVLLEAINQMTMPGYFLTTQAQSARLVEAVAQDNVAMQFDCFHCQMQEGNVGSRLERYLPHIGHIQIAGAPQRQEPDGGELRYEYLFALMDRLGYAGYVGCEYHPAGSTAAGLGWFEPWKASQ